MVEAEDHQTHVCTVPRVALYCPPPSLTWPRSELTSAPCSVSSHLQPANLRYNNNIFLRKNCSHLKKATLEILLLKVCLAKLTIKRLLLPVAGSSSSAGSEYRSQLSAKSELLIRIFVRKLNILTLKLSKIRCF